MWLSENPIAAAVVAAQILKLWLLMPEGAILQKCNAFLNSSVKSVFVIGDCGEYWNRGPGWLPLKHRYCLIILTGQCSDGVLGSTWSGTSCQLLCLEEVKCTVRCWGCIWIWWSISRWGFAYATVWTVISPILRKAWKAKENIAWNRACRYFPEIVWLRDAVSWCNIVLSMGRRESNVWFCLWYACNNFCMKKAAVGSEHSFILRA